MLRRLLTAAFALMLSTSGAHALSGASDPSVVVGVMATLTGPGAITSQDAVDGFYLGLKELGNRFSNQEVRVVVLDDKGSADLAKQQVSRMLERERIDMVVTALSPPSFAAVIQPLLSARVFVFNLDQMPPAQAGAGCSPWLFGLAPPLGGVHEALGQHLTATQVRRVALVLPPFSLSAPMVEAFRHSFAGEVVATLTPRPGATTFASEFAAIARHKPDAIYSLLSGGMGGAFVRAWYDWPERGEMAFYSQGGGLERPYLPAMGEAAEDVADVGTWSPDMDTPVNRRFVSDFELEYGRQATTWAAQGFDAAFLIDAALRATNGKTGDPDAIRAALRRAEFTSVRGSFKFNSNHTPVLSYLLRKVGQDAKGRTIPESQQPVLKEWRDRQAQSCSMHWVEEVIPLTSTKKP